LTHESFEKALSAYKGWEIIASEEGKLILLKRENDIAPSCKENGYFGLSQDGVLTLFNGVPGEKQVIQSFYQINRAKMEASLPAEEIALLQNGIRVRDLSEYNSVLSTYSEFQEEAAMAESH
jgi:forespore regulator of the sigma-K checkpoint